jgi:hypothetical protein
MKSIRRRDATVGPRLKYSQTRVNVRVQSPRTENVFSNVFYRWEDFEATVYEWSVIPHDRGD